IPVVADVVNAVNRSAAGRVLLEKTLGVARDSPLPTYHSRTARQRLRRLARAVPGDGTAAPALRPTEHTTGKVALFTTCYANRNEPELDEDLVAVFEHNGIVVTLIARSEEHTSELQSPYDLVCRLLLEKKKQPQTHAQRPSIIVSDDLSVTRLQPSGH